MKRKRGFTLIEIMTVVLILAILFHIAVTTYSATRERTRTRACIKALTLIRFAKEQWAMNENAPVTATPAQSDLVPEYLKKFPECHNGGIYTIGSIDTDPICSIGGTHRLQ